MCGENMTMNFPLDLLDSPNLPLLHQINWFQTAYLTNLQRRKNSILREVVARGSSARTWEIPVLQSLSNTVKDLWKSLPFHNYGKLFWFGKLDFSRTSVRDELVKWAKWDMQGRIRNFFYFAIGFRTFVRQTKLAVIPVMRNVFILRLINNHPRLWEIFCSTPNQQFL